MVNVAGVMVMEVLVWCISVTLTTNGMRVVTVGIVV